MNTSRLDPTLTITVDKIREIISLDGFCTIEEFQAVIAENTDVNENIVLQTLAYGGVTYTKATVGEGAKIEVLVDIRLLAVAQLIAYFDKDYAKHHFVLDFVKAVYGSIDHPTTNAMSYQMHLVADTYKQNGHRFTLFKIADNAIITDDGGSACVTLLKRHISALRELVKHEEQLTAVYQLATSVFQLIDTKSGEPIHSIYRPAFDTPGSSYNHFYKMAVMLLNKHK